MDINMNMMSHPCHHHDHDHDHDHPNKLYTTTTTSWDGNLNMVMDQQNHHDDDHNHIMPMLDPMWPNYNLLPTPHQSPPSIQLPNTSSTPLIIKSHDHHHHHHQEVLIEEEEEEEIEEEEEEEELGAMKEMMYRIAVMQPVDVDPATIRKPKRRNVRISDDPQSVAARHRRERISEKIRILQRLVPGGTKMDTASMLDEAVRYVKFLKRQIRQLQRSPAPPPPLPPHLPLISSDWPGPSQSGSGPGPTLAPIVRLVSEDSKIVGL